MWYSQREAVVEFNSKHARGISTRGGGEGYYVCGSDPFRFGFFDKTEKVMGSWWGLELSGETITEGQLNSLYDAQ